MGDEAFKRKILSEMQDWKDTGLNRKKALLIKGLRQVGKTFIVKEFARRNYENIVYIDFRSEKGIRKAFQGDFDIDLITLQISAYKDVSFVPGKTVVIMDEVQDCAEARSSVKYFVEDGRYDIIETGSLLGIKGYNRKGDRGVPIGFEHIIHMRPMDFEEFLWARGMKDEVLSVIRDCFVKRMPAPGALDSMMTRYFREFICVGGMPEAVSAFIEGNNFNRVSEVQRNLLEQHRDDFGKYIDENGDTKVDMALKLRINAVFESIPAQLSKEYKKFQYSKVKRNGRSDEYRDAIQWLEDAGLVSICYNLKLLDPPLEGNKDPDAFKIYMSDSGLFISMLDYGTVAEVMSGNLGIYKGAVYEEIVADILTKMGRRLYYYRRDSSLEIDFIVRYGQQTALMEVKSKDGRTKAAKTVLNDFDRYGIRYCIKLNESRMGESGNILTIPHYMAFLLEERGGAGSGSRTGEPGAIYDDKSHRGQISLCDKSHR